MNWNGQLISFLPLLANDIEQLSSQPRPAEKPRVVGSRIAHMSLVGVLDFDYLTLKREQIFKLAADETVRSIVLQVNSPGGSASGTEELAQMVRRTVRIKPVDVIAENLLCSAAYHVCCQATSIAASPSTMVGSIGTVLYVTDASEMYSRLGIRVIPIATGIRKYSGHPGVPFVQEHYDMLQHLIDLTQAPFESAVERGRKFNQQQLAAVADGSIWTAPAAKNRGLIDHVTLPEDRYAELERQYPTEPFAGLTGRAAAEKFESLALAAAKLDGDYDIEDVPESIINNIRAEHPTLSAAAMEYSRGQERPRARRFR